MKYKEVSMAEVVKKGFFKIAKIAYSGDVPKGRPSKPTPILLTRFRKPYVIIQRYTDDVEKLEELKAGKITWDDFRDQMLQKGYEQMVKGETKVRATDVVGAERVEVERQRVKVEGAQFMLEAAKYFQGRVYICDNCGHTMLPATHEQEEKYINGEITESPKDSTDKS